MQRGVIGTVYCTVDQAQTGPANGAYGETADLILAPTFAQNKLL